MRADSDSTVRGHALQLHADAEPARSRDPARGRLAGARVHTARASRLLALVEVLSLRRLCTDVYRTGRRGPRHTAVSVHVRRGRRLYLHLFLLGYFALGIEVRSVAMRVSVCLSARISQRTRTNCMKFSAYYLWPWLRSPLTTMQYVTCFRFCG